MNRNNRFTFYYRVCRLVLHVLYGMAIAGVIFPWLSQKSRNRVTRYWSNSLLGILNVHIHLKGVAPDLASHNVMFVANHVSWLDIHLLNAVRPARFVSKSEVRDWPVIGWLAQKVGTLFIERTKRHDTARVNHAVSAALNNGDCIVVFPEGTTSSGKIMRPFHASLLQPAVPSQSVIWPIALRYVHADASINTAPAYADDITLKDSMVQVLSQPVIHAEMMYLETISAHGKTRKELAKAAERVISSALNLVVPCKGSGKPDDLPAAQQKVPLPTDSHCPAP